MMIRHSIKELLAKNSVTRPMKYIVVYLNIARKNNIKIMKAIVFGLLF